MKKNYQDIEQNVKLWITGKNGNRIGLIYPDEQPTEDEWRKFNQDIAELVYNNFHQIK